MTLPDASRLSPRHPLFGEIMAAHDAAVARGDKTYTDPASGLLVLTRRAHLERGTCCSSGCRHCPYVES